MKRECKEKHQEASSGSESLLMQCICLIVDNIVIAWIVFLRINADVLSF